jgi:hypothetical protein
MMPFTSPFESLAITQPIAPDREWVSKIAGPAWHRPRARAGNMKRMFVLRTAWGNANAALSSNQRG